MFKFRNARCTLAACTALGLIAAVCSGSNAYARSPSGGGFSGHSMGSNSFGGNSMGYSGHSSGGTFSSTPKFDTTRVLDKSTGPINSLKVDKLTSNPGINKINKIDPLLSKKDPNINKIDPQLGKIGKIDPKLDPKLGKIDPKLDPKLGKVDPKLGKDKLALGNKLKPIDPGFNKKGNKKFPTPWCTPWWCYGGWPCFGFNCCCFDCFCFNDCWLTEYVCPETVVVEEVIQTKVDPVYTLYYKNGDGATQMVGQFDPVVDRQGLTAAEAKLTSQGLPWWATNAAGSVVESNIGA